MSWAPVGYGALELTWTTNIPPDEQAFDVLNAALASGITYWQFGTYYSMDQTMENLLLLSRYFSAYPEHINRVFLAVKGGFAPFNDLTRADSSIETLRQELAAAFRSLGRRKRVDLFLLARKNPDVKNKQIGETLKRLVDEGLCRHVGLCEVSSQTIREVHAVYPLAAVEAEYNPLALDLERAGILATVKELGIALIASRPLARGIFTGTLKSRDDLPAGDPRQSMPRFSDQAFEHNLRLAEPVAEIAAHEGIPLVQLVLAWELAQYEKLILIPGTTRPELVRQNADAANLVLSPELQQQLRQIFEGFASQVQGERFSETGAKIAYA